MSWGWFACRPSESGQPASDGYWVCWTCGFILAAFAVAGIIAVLT
jgi:hypothetical protein